MYNDYTVSAMLYTSIQTAFLACIRYWLYQDNLRIPLKWMYTLIFSIILGGTGVWVITGGIPGISFSIFRITLAFIMFLLSCFIIKEPFAKHTYTYSFIMVYDSTLEISAFFIQNRIAPGERGLVFALVATLLLGLSFIPATRYLKRMIDKLTMLENDRIWVWLCVISFSFVIMNLLFTYPLKEPLLLHLLSRYLLLLGIIGLYAATSRAMKTMSEAAQAKVELELTKKRIELQESYYTQLVSQMGEVRRIRHDLRHYLAAISALIKGGDTAALSEYIKDITIDTPVPVTGNLAADSILLYYTDAAKLLGTTVDIELSIEKEIPISDPDLCVILGNLLENAVDAQHYLPPESRYIRVTARAVKNSLTLAVDNRFDGTLIERNGSYLTRKEGEGHGIGLASVDSVCKKYGGVLQIEIEDDMFMAGVVIGI